MTTYPQHVPFFLDANKDILGRMNKKICDYFLEDPTIPDAVTLIRTKTDTITIKYKNVLLHSVYDPEKEARKFIAAQDIREGNVVVVYGLGLAYHIKEILRRIGPKGKVFVLEPNLDILKAAFLLVDMRPFCEDPRCYIISAADEESVALRFLSVVNKEIYDVSDELKNIVIHSPSFKCLPGGYEKLQNIFEMLLIERRVPQVFEEINQKNIRANLEHIITSPGIRQLQKTFAGRPALFVNAGPSLDGSLPAVKRYKDRAVVFCSDTAFPVLVSNDITPDFVLSVDPQDKSASHFEGFYQSDATLIFTPVSCPAILRRYRGKKVLVLQKDHSVTGKFQEGLAHKGFTNAGSSVSCIGLDILLLLDCDPVIFVGMDYSFPYGKMYSSQVSATRRWGAACSKLCPLETIHFKAISREKVIYIQNKFGEAVPTYQNMFTYLKHIEGLIEDTPHKQFYNFLSHGAHIEGTDEVFLEEELNAFMPHDIQKEIKVIPDEYDAHLERMILNTIG